EKDREIDNPAYGRAWQIVQVLLDMVGKEPLARTFQPRTWHWHAERDEYLLEEHIVREGWRWIEHHWMWIHGAEQQGFTFGIRLYSGAELTDAFGQPLGSAFVYA